MARGNSGNGSGPLEDLRDPRSLRVHPQAGSVPAIARREFGAFCADIGRRGVVVPLEITGRGVVVDGSQRLRAALELELALVPVRTVAPVDEFDYMLRAAITRRDLTPSQRAAIALDLDEYQQLAVEGRRAQVANLRQNRTEVATLPPRGKTRDTVAAWAGVSARTVQDAETVRRHDSAVFQRVKDRKITASVAARKIRQRLRDQALPPAPPLPDGPFDLLYADPPWQLGNPDGPWAPENHYSTMPLEEIVALRPPMGDDAVLFLWVTPGLVPAGVQVMAAWGFTFKAEMIWMKPSIGLGNTVRFQHESLLIGRKGNYPAPDPEDRPPSVIQAPRGRHSEKPKVFYELIERMYPAASKLELFARNQRTGWTAWGNEVDS